ncbi:phage tail tip lysozyme [Acetobacter sicerae]|uniref:phage tail tip lysozyme n=1 Tax=Acetobacter sicerae TaxID=85325 RepID=UPI00156A8388|nr:phage tail tip lysozyme [Acetobacter sicerae]NHN93443.1 hypothetical protein [Acetobacter sicerae]
MADAGVIKEFLVSLGWAVDRQGQQKFDDAIAGAKTAALALGATLAGVVASVGKVAQAYEQMGYAAQRAQSSVSGMQGFAYAVSQMGGNAQAAAQSLQSMGNFLRSSPGAASFLSRLGVQAQDAHGNLRDTSAIMGDLAAKFRSMPYWQAKSSAGVLGIDENTLQAMIRGLGQFWPEYQRVYKMAGISQEQATKAGAGFMQQLRSLGIVLQALRDKVGISLMRGVGGDIARLRALILSNFGRISGAIETAARVVLSLGEALMQLLSRGGEIMASLFDWFTHLDRGTRQWIVGLGLLALAWKVMNTAFMATPIGRVIALGLAILALYDDYKSWQKGGEHLVDWAKWKPGIDAAVDGINALGDLLKNLWPDVKPYMMPIVDFVKNEVVGAFTEARDVLVGMAKLADDVVRGRWGAAKKDASSIWKIMQDNDAATGADIKNTWNEEGGLIRNAQKKKLMGEAMQTLQSLGVDATHAAAMVGNFVQESTLNPYARNVDQRGNVHYGVEQWDDTRADAILSGTGIDVRRAGLADQLKAAVWEIRNGAEKQGGNGFFRTNGLMQAAHYFAQNIERSGESGDSQGMKNRLSGASIAYDVGTQSGATTTTNAPVTLHQNITNNISGSGNPQATGQAVADRQQDATARLTRNLKMRRG